MLSAIDNYSYDFDFRQSKMKFSYRLQKYINILNHLNPEKFRTEATKGRILYFTKARGARDGDIYSLTN
jgi:hypothetical protein